MGQNKDFGGVQHLKKQKLKVSQLQPAGTEVEPEFIGNQIRRLRLRRATSVRGLAKIVGISPSYLSAIERGLESPSLKILRSLATTLGVPFFAILSGGHNVPAINRAAKRPRLRFTDSQIEYEIVSLDPGREVQVYIGHLAPGATNTSNPVGHGTSSEECLFILSGRVVVYLIDQRWELDKNDYLHFDGAIPHQIVADQSGPASFLSITTGTFPGWSDYDPNSMVPKDQIGFGAFRASKQMNSGVVARKRQPGSVGASRRKSRA